MRAHTVFDRTLLRAGETVSMKHFVRTETTKGLAAMPPAQPAARVKIVHQGSGQELQPLQWNGGGSAVSTWSIPPAAKLGVYTVSLERDAPRQPAGRSTTRPRPRSGRAANSASKSFACRWWTRASAAPRACRSRRASFRSTCN